MNKISCDDIVNPNLEKKALNLLEPGAKKSQMFLLRLVWCTQVKNMYYNNVRGVILIESISTQVKS